MPVAAKKKPEAESKVVTLKARDIFSVLQDTPLEILKKTSRLDMLDYWDADSVFDVQNATGGYSHIMEMSPSYISVQLSPVSIYEIKVLPSKKGDVVMTIYTVGDSIQAPDSYVRFYSQDLKPVPTETYLKTPRIENYFRVLRDPIVPMSEIVQAIRFPNIAIMAAADTDMIVAGLTSLRRLSEEDRNRIEPYLRDPLVSFWDNGFFQFDPPVKYAPE